MLEKRKYLRIPFKGPVYGKIKFISELQDISINGCFVKTSTKLPEGTLIDLEFTLPNTSRIIHATGEIRWYGQYSSDRRTEATNGVGLKFVDISVENIGAINEFIKLAAADRRKYDRIRKTAKVIFSKDPNKLDQRATVNDLSLGGLFINTPPERYKLEELIFMNLDVDQSGNVIQCSGKIKYINDKIPEIFKGLIPSGFGVEFVDISETDLENLDTYLQKTPG